MNIYALALRSQTACNLSGLVMDLKHVAEEIWNEPEVKQGGTQAFNNHPVMRLFAEQIAHLTQCRTWEEAWKICLEKSDLKEEA
jgi:hypothetical protein